MSTTTYRQARLAFLDLSVGLWRALAIFMAIIAVIFLVIGMVVVSVSDSGTTESVWENSAYATRYFPLSMGIMITGAYLPVAVASGVTRRGFSYAGSAIVLGMAGLMAVLEAAGYLIEYGVYELTGDTPEYTTPHLFDSGYESWIVIPEVWIVVAANVAAGWLIGSAYYKWGWLGPTLALPLMLVPTLVVEALMSVGWAGAAMDAMGFDRLPDGLAVAASLLALALTLFGIQRFTRTIDIRPQKA